MKLFTFVLFALISVNVSAGPYTDFGLGYIQTIPGKSNVILERNGNVIVHLNERANVDLDSPFFMVRFGYRWDPSNIHLEYNRFGLLSDDTASISSARLYKRIESKLGFYADIGGGYVIDVPSESRVETEVEGPIVLTARQTATIELDSPFPMIRVGYRWKSTNLHLEVERIGDLFKTKERISTLTLYKRWEW